MTAPTIARQVDQYLTPPSMEVPRWEYAILHYEWALSKLDTITRELNEMGACGWVLADERKLVDSVRQYQAPNLHLTFVFKRRTA